MLAATIPEIPSIPASDSPSDDDGDGLTLRSSLESGSSAWSLVDKLLLFVRRMLFKCGFPMTEATRDAIFECPCCVNGETEKEWMVGRCDAIMERRMTETNAICR